MSTPYEHPQAFSGARDMPPEPRFQPKKYGAPGHKRTPLNEDYSLNPRYREVPLFTSLGSGVRWRHEEQLMANLPPMGKKSFRILCRRLCIPLIHAKRGCYVDHLSFCLVMRFISRIGAPEFLLPGCTRLQRLAKENLKAQGFAYDLDLKTFLAHKEQMISELVAGARIAGLKLPDDFTRDARRTAQRLAAMSALIPFSRRAATEAVTDRTHDSPSHYPTIPLPPLDYDPTDEDDCRLDLSDTSEPLSPRGRPKKQVEGEEFPNGTAVP